MGPHSPVSACGTDSRRLERGEDVYRHTKAAGAQSAEAGGKGTGQPKALN
jgi:hypothetical protein